MHHRGVYLRRLFYGKSNLDDLLFGFNGAGSCDHCKITATNLGIANLDNRILWAEFTIRLLKWFGHSLNRVNDLEAGKKFHINTACISYET